ncbi:DUF6416 domain-containing protein [Streptomyces yangpuensis]|uniref:DUF6416 domain-containing protein n=1 Tax=Streptomyces yangpuensis TaxID=1648182 RepID=UPI003653271A
MRYLNETDPEWDRHDGGAGHDEAPWGAADGDLAHAYLAALRAQGTDNARRVFDHLIEHPGAQVTSAELDERVLGAPAGEVNPHRVSGVVSAMCKPLEGAGRRYPFTWWEQEVGVGARYGVRPSVAAVFLAARIRLDRGAGPS